MSEDRDEREEPDMSRTPKQAGMRIGETRKAWLEGQLDMMIDTSCPITIERKGAQDFVFHFLAVGKTWGTYAGWLRYMDYPLREAKSRFRHEFGLIGAHISFAEGN